MKESTGGYTYKAKKRTTDGLLGISNGPQRVS